MRYAIQTINLALGQSSLRTEGGADARDLVMAMAESIRPFFGPSCQIEVIDTFSLDNPEMFAKCLYSRSGTRGE